MSRVNAQFILSDNFAAGKFKTREEDARHALNELCLERRNDHGRSITYPRLHQHQRRLHGVSIVFLVNQGSLNRLADRIPSILLSPINSFSYSIAFI